MKKHLLILFIFLLPTFLMAQTLVFVSSEFPPYIYKKQKRIKGFNVEILNAIFKRMHIKVEYRIVPWARGVNMLKEGEVDAMFPFFKTKQREHFTEYSASFTSEPIAMFVLKDSPITYTGDLKTLSAYKFGRVRGFSSGAFFDEALKENIIQVEDASTSTSNLKKLFRKRFDILVENQFLVLHELKKENQLQELKQLHPILSNTKAYLGFSKKRNHTQLIVKFNKVLKEIKEDGTYDKIINNYFLK